MYSEDDLVPISGLQHLAFCERQWALIHLEQQWEENRLTAEGRQLHERADEGEEETREGIRICRGLHLRSLRLGLTGRADVVEFHPNPGGSTKPRPFPVEYKRGRPKPDHRDDVQLCAQALCLEEMLKVEIESGALFYGTPRRRTNVVFDADLRAETERLAARLHELYVARVTPKARYEKKCDRCSLYSICLPKTTGAVSSKSASQYVKRAIEAALAELPPDPAGTPEP